jgi:hypothetical protein
VEEEDPSPACGDQQHIGCVWRELPFLRRKNKRIAQNRRDSVQFFVARGASDGL